MNREHSKREVEKPPPPVTNEELEAFLAYVIAETRSDLVRYTTPDQMKQTVLLWHQFKRRAR